MIGRQMANDHLRVYYGPDDDRGLPLSQVKAGGKVDISLSELFETMTDATIQGLVWTEDFREEKVSISTDLFEVISAYRRMKKSA